MTTSLIRPLLPSADHAQQAMYAVGVVEVPAGIIVDRVTGPGLYDVALRDFGLLVGAVALARLAVRYAPATRSGSHS